VRVYGWQGHRHDAPGNHHQTREICAALSMAAVARVAGVKYTRDLFNLCETGNAAEVAKATSEPGVIFWRGLNEFSNDAAWRRA
jgi:hypothetical protein